MSTNDAQPRDAGISLEFTISLASKWAFLLKLIANFTGIA
jgi:hypothetical protein